MISHEAGGKIGHRFAASRILRFNPLDQPRPQNRTAIGDGRIGDGYLHRRHGHFTLPETNVCRVAITPVRALHLLQRRENTLRLLPRRQAGAFAKINFWAMRTTFSIPARRPTVMK